VSHDLRTPLASILGSATTLKFYCSGLDEAAQAQLIDTIQDEVECLKRFLRSSLNTQAYRTIEAESGADALARLAAERVDAVVFDLGLPDIDGLDVPARFRAPGSSVPVVVLFSRTDIFATFQMVARCEQAGPERKFLPCRPSEWP
jgi:CheY-like chemotaxis protein